MAPLAMRLRSSPSRAHDASALGQPLDDSVPSDEREVRFRTLMQSLCVCKRAPEHRGTPPPPPPNDPLLVRSARSGLQVQAVRGDGNCLFRAAAVQAMGDEDRHGELRGLACDWLQARADELRDHVEEGAFEEHVATMRCDGEWGSELEIRALEGVLGRRITIYANHVDSIEPLNTHFGLDGAVEPTDDAPPLLLSYHGRAHYNALVPA